MTNRLVSPLRALPSVDRVLGWPASSVLIERHGRSSVTAAVREVLAGARAELATAGEEAAAPAEHALLAEVERRLQARSAPTLRRVLNLTGTVLHTNLGRAPLPEEALAAIAGAAGASNLEYDLDSGRRGDRDAHVEGLLCELSGAEAATVVNNNAAAVLLALNTLALRKRVPVSRGELIEIGGAFRMPDVMARAGCKLVEIGTTNRTHLKDYAGAIDTRTALLLKVHTSNYVVRGFTASVGEAELAALAHRHELPLVVDLGSGSLVDLRRYGLPEEPTVCSVVAAGADLIAFSGDKLLGGPQAGLVVGRADLIRRLKRNPMKRALRADKMTLAALAAVLRLYRDPERLAERIPALRALTRPREDIEAMAARVGPRLEAALGASVSVEMAPCASQIGSGALPVQALESAALKLTPHGRRRGSSGALRALAARLRGLPVPVIGRIGEGALWLDLRCLEDEADLLGQLGELSGP